MKDKLSEYIKYYNSNIEEYIFNELSNKFKKDGLSIEDFFVICSWKSTRPLKKILNGLIKKNKGNNQSIKDFVKKFTKELFQNKNHEERLKMLLEIDGIHLAMASAILTVLDKEKYTIYDFRVCEYKKMKQYKKLQNKEKSKLTWKEYEQYINAIKEIQEEENIKSLRETDKSLWAKSFITNLRNNIKNEFRK